MGYGVFQNINIPETLSNMAPIRWRAEALTTGCDRKLANPVSACKKDFLSF